MATAEAALYAVAKPGSQRPTASAGAWASAALTLVAIAVHGYHPYAEDGGVYLAGIEKVLDPQLFPRWGEFVTTHLKFSLFAPTVAGLVRATHIGLMPAVLLLYLATIWLTLFAGWLLASRCFSHRIACLGAVTLLALALTIPVAGTSLMLMDPYVTARSISTPCGILMLVGIVDLHAQWTEQHTVSFKAIALFAASMFVAAAMHPLMAAYALAYVLLFECLFISNRTARIATVSGMCVSGFVLAGCMEAMSPANSLSYAEVARSRTYWFLGTWHWFELLGLAGPVLVLLALAWRDRDAIAGTSKRLALAAAFAGCTATLVAVFFAQVSSRSYEVAKLQPLRIYQTIYFLMLLALGGALADRVLKRSVLRWAAMFVVLGGAMMFVQRQTFPYSTHVEVPGRVAANSWQEAFLWIRIHTPQDAVFALDANYISAPGEDSQNFRATAERSAMPDYAKDGGIAAIAPALTAQWFAGEAAQKGLDEGLGPEQIARLRAYGVSWAVVTRQTPASIACAYANAAVKVCALP